MAIGMDDLRAAGLTSGDDEHRNGAAPVDQDDPAAFLTAQLGVPVTGARVFGRGPTARVDLIIADQRPVTFERFGDIAKPAALSTHLVTATGVYKAFKAPAAGRIAAAIFSLAEHHAEDDRDQTAREWGAEFLRVAPTIDVDMADQADRWRAFEQLARLSPARDAGEDRSAWALAAASTVLVDNGVRFVRTGWFGGYVKREVGGLYSPAALAAQMEAVGWTRPNSEGRIKATSPSDDRRLGFRFYVVSPAWPDSQVPAGSQDYARAHMRARGHVVEPAGTRNPEDDELAERAERLRNGDVHGRFER